MSATVGPAQMSRHGGASALLERVSTVVNATVLCVLKFYTAVDTYASLLFNKLVLDSHVLTNLGQPFQLSPSLQVGKLACLRTYVPCPTSTL